MSAIETRLGEAEKRYLMSEDVDTVKKWWIPKILRTVGNLQAGEKLQQQAEQQSTVPDKKFSKGKKKAQFPVRDNTTFLLRKRICN